LNGDIIVTFQMLFWAILSVDLYAADENIWRIITRSLSWYSSWNTILCTHIDIFYIRFLSLPIS